DIASGAGRQQFQRARRESPEILRHPMHLGDEAGGVADKTAWLHDTRTFSECDERVTLHMLQYLVGHAEIEGLVCEMEIEDVVFGISGLGVYERIKAEYFSEIPRTRESQAGFAFAIELAPLPA